MSNEQQTRGAVERRGLLLRWGLPRETRATELVLAFVLVTVATVVVIRAFLQLTGFPQVGGDSLHVAHVLWGGLAMALAVVLAVSFAGPAVRPLVAVLGGIGFGLFIDEVGKFLTNDNDYFFQPAPMLIYVTLVLIALGADVLHGRRELRRGEYLAAAVDYGVAGVAGGLSPHRRAVAERLVEKAGDTAGRDEVAALLAVVADDDDEAPDPVAAVRRWLRGVFSVVVRRRWTVPVMVVLLAELVLGSATAVVLAVVWGSGPTWAVVTAAVSLVLVVAAFVRGWWVWSSQPADGAGWLRRGVELNLLVTQVALFRLDGWIATAGLVSALLALGVISAEKLRGETAAIE
ncbi:hypothetical protein [Georgenia sunbinii]|uniref:hypothetical protein n=1 Tax=Georgenia sunbinii TaxID=3117728 RepID=UPI002F263620